MLENILMSLGVLFKSSALQRAGAHWRSELEMLSLPVVHWHLVSVREQPEPWTAVAKQGIWSSRQSTYSSSGRRKRGEWELTAQLGTLLRS
jgi:hypothetical protein